MPKRKRGIAQPTEVFKKRTKAPPSSPLSKHPHGDVEYGVEYKARSIIDENNTQYLIDWEDDPKTGKKYDPSWEPKANANSLLLKDWQKAKALKLKAQKASVKARENRSESVQKNPTPNTTSIQAAEPVTPTRKRGRPKNIIVSSSPAEVPPLHTNGNSEAQQPAEPEIVETPQAAPGAGNDSGAPNSPLFEPVELETPSQPEPEVQVNPPPSSFAAGAYQTFDSSGHPTSSLNPDQSTAVETQTAVQTAKVPAVQLVPKNFGGKSTTLVADSQSGAEWSSSSPTTILKKPSSHIEAAPAAQVASSASRPVRTKEPTGKGIALQQQSHNGQVWERHESRSEQLRPETVSQASLQEPAAGTEADAQVTKVTGRSGLLGATSANSENQVPNWEGSQVQGQPKGAHLESPTRPPLEGRPIEHPTTLNYQNRSPVPTAATARSSFPFQTQIARPLSSAATHSQLLQHATNQVRSLHTSTLRASSLPAGHSSPLVSAPSRSLGTLGESTPAQPVTPSSPSDASTSSFGRVMATSQRTSDLGATLKALRESYRASRKLTSTIASQTQTSAPGSVVPVTQASRLAFLNDEQDRRSPSAVPAMEPLPIITQDEMNTSERYETLLPQSQQRADDQPNEIISSRATPTRPKDQHFIQPPSTSHLVPVGLLGHQRDQYPQMIYHHRDLIKRFLSESDPDPDLIAKAELFVERMSRITLHPDLDNVETLTQYEVGPPAQAQWDVDCSAKFRFLKELLENLSDQRLHVVVVAPEGRILSILETFLTGLRVPHASPEAGKTLQNDHDGLFVTIASNPTEKWNANAAGANLVVAMDPTVSDQAVNVARLGGKSTAVTLVVPQSVDHIRLSLSPTLSTRVRLQAQIRAINQLRNEAGKLNDDQFAPDMAALELAQYIRSDNERAEWLLGTLVPLGGLDSQTESEVEAGVTDTPPSRGSKRPFERDGLDAARDVSKKARTELVQTGSGSPQGVDITHVSDSVAKPTQSIVGQPASSDGSTELRLQKLLMEAQERMDDLNQALSDLQYRHEDQREKLIKVTSERDAAIITAQQAISRMSENANKLSTVKAACTGLKEQLETANAKLSDHSVPERVELEALRLKLAEIQSAKERVQNRLERAKSDLEYTQSIYQSSSNSAKDLATHNTELEKQLAVAQNVASGEQAKLRQLGYDAQTRRLRDENKKLKAMLSDREAGLKFRDEEIARLKEASRGRMGTRGSSVPRSPRLGSRNGSRQGSPAAGEPKAKVMHLHPLRNG